MAAVTPDQFWTLLAESKLVEPAPLDKLRREYEGLPFPPGTSAASASDPLARWLVKRGAVSEWQAKRLLRGEKGPFFIGDYRLLDRFDTGRGGAVFRARHEPTGRLVGITALVNKFCQEPAVWSDILKRTKGAHEAADPVLTRTWALEKAGTQRFVLSEDVVGVPISEELSRRGALPVAEAGEIVLAVARAVAELHRRGLVHGGISLDTVRREPAPVGAAEKEGAVRLLQFPLVADPHVVPPRVVLDDAEGVTRLGHRAAFIAPEALRAGRISDASGDVYALGCLFHALLSGAPPGWQGDPQRTLAHVAAGNGLPALPPAKVPVEVATLVSYLAARSPADRYPTAAEAADAIAACLGKPPVSGSLPPQEPWIVPRSGPADAAEEAEVPAVALIDTGPTPGSRSPGAKPATKPVAKKTRPTWLVPALGGLGLLAASLVGAFVLLGTPKKQTPRPDASSPSASEDEEERASAAPERGDGRDADGSVAGPKDSGAARPTSTALVDAKGAEGVPYEAPEPAGPPPRLRYLPPGSQLVLLCRPAAALATDEGKLFVRSLGPRAAEALATLARRSGVEPEGIEEIQAGWQAGGPDEVIGGVVVRGVGPLPPAGDEAARREALGATDAEEVDGETLHTGAAGTAWFPSDAEGRVLFLGPESLVREAVAAHRAADPEAALEAVLPTDLEELVGMLDGSRHLTLFGSPDYLLHDGRPVLAGPLAKLVEPLGRFFGDSVRAAALSAHFGPDAYLELDAVAPAGSSAGGLAKHLAANVATMSEAVEEYCNALDPHPYGRKLVMRLPRMLDVVADQIHSGPEGRGAIVNAWLPAHAPHNLALAAELALEQVPRAAGEAVAATDGPVAAKQGAAEALAKPMSLAFVKDTLEKSIQMIAEEIGIEMEILGSDLQLEGITQNQSFGLEERNKPAVEILRKILAKANPDGKLVYVIRSGPAGEKVEITTRAAVEKRGDVLPPGQDPAADGEGTGDDQQEQEQR